MYRILEEFNKAKSTQYFWVQKQVSFLGFTWWSFMEYKYGYKTIERAREMKTNLELYGTKTHKRIVE